MIGAGVLHSSVRQDWKTPDDVLDVVRQVGSIGLDPCTHATNPTDARRFFYPEVADGLGRPWPVMRAGEIAYINPPYGRECSAWVERCITEGRAGLPIVLLVAARPGSRWCQALLSSADAVCFWRGRIRFRGATASAPFDSLFAAWNCRPRFVEAFAPHGVIAGRVA